MLINLVMAAQYQSISDHLLVNKNYYLASQSYGDKREILCIIDAFTSHLTLGLPLSDPWRCL